MTGRSAVVVAAALAAVLATVAGAADDPWYVDGEVTITAPTDLGDVIVLPGGSLTVSGVGEPGLRMAGNLWVVGDGRVRLEDSVVEFLSTYHGQYALAGIDDAEIEVVRCRYRVPGGVQHGLVAAGRARITAVDTDFDSVQLVPVEDAHISARSCDGRFEVVVQHDASVELADIPRTPGGGEVWVWPEFPAGSSAVYTPPMPGFVEAWEFPPPGATGIRQRCSIERCRVLLWPMLVREDVELVLRDIPEDNWVVVGFHLPESTTVSDLRNGTWGDGLRLGFDDRDVVLERASVDTFNLYPSGPARLVVRGCLLGEILVMGGASALVEDSVIDGSGGYLGVDTTSRLLARDTVFTCDVQASGEAVVRLERCALRPYPQDPTGDWTRLSVHDDARVLAAQTTVETTPVLGGSGLVAVAWLSGLPAAPPGPGETVPLVGAVGQYSLDPALGPGTWRLEAAPHWGHRGRTLAEGSGELEGQLATWTGADPTRPYDLRIVLEDGRGRRFSSTWPVGAAGSPASTPGTAAPRPSASRRTAGPARTWRGPAGPASAAGPARPPS